MMNLGFYIDSSFMIKANHVVLLGQSNDGTVNGLNVSLRWKRQEMYAEFW
jgi:hypothetical protein